MKNLINHARRLNSVSNNTEKEETSSIFHIEKIGICTFCSDDRVPWIYFTGRAERGGFYLCGGVFICYIKLSFDIFTFQYLNIFLCFISKKSKLINLAKDRRH